MEITREEALEVLLLLEESYSSGGIFNQALIVNQLGVEKVGKAFQLLIDDKTIHTFTSIRVWKEPLYFQKFAMSLIDCGACRCETTNKERKCQDLT